MKKGTISFEELPTSDLLLDAIYEGGIRGNASDDPISKLVGVGNQGGFRIAGTIVGGDVKVIVLYTTMDDVDWPDTIDYETGLFYYYGDNKQPGHELHDTPRKGNVLLRNLFESIHLEHPNREKVPPILIFSKAGNRRDVIFRGIAVPGAESIPHTEDLVAVWKTQSNRRFQNYRAIFTVLDVSVIRREWIHDLLRGNAKSIYAPDKWSKWVSSGVAIPLKAPRVLEHRSRDQQLPATKHSKELLQMVRSHFADDPYAFENFAGELLKLAESNISSMEITRPTRDGGRDAIGRYRLQMGQDRIHMDFAVEAKCYGERNSVGVKETSRLISRLRHRQFGLLVTTSYVADQAYREIREDQHPILIIAGNDIIEILTSKGVGTKAELSAFLSAF